MTFEEAKAAPLGTIFIDREEDDARFIVLRGPGAICAYVGVHKSHQFIELRNILEVEDKLEDKLDSTSSCDIDLSCHGGITYEGMGEINALPRDYLFFGWDYSHAGDAFLFDGKVSSLLAKGDAKQWTPEMVDTDSKQAVEEFKVLLRRAKQIRSIEFE